MRLWLRPERGRKNDVATVTARLRGVRALSRRWATTCHDRSAGKMRWATTSGWAGATGRGFAALGRQLALWPRGLAGAHGRDGSSGAGTQAPPPLRQGRTPPRLFRGYGVRGGWRPRTGPTAGFALARAASSVTDTPRARALRAVAWRGVAAAVPSPRCGAARRAALHSPLSTAGVGVTRPARRVWRAWRAWSEPGADGFGERP